MVQPYRWLTFAGFLRHLSDLDDAWRWRFMSTILGMREGFPQETYDRCARHANFTLHTDAAWLAARVSPRGLVLASSFTSVPDLGAQVYPFLPVRLMSRFSYDTMGAVRTLKAPLLVAHSPEDDIIPYAHGRALFAAGNEPKQFLELKGGHNEGFLFGRQEWVAQVGTFLERAAIGK